MKGFIVSAIAVLALIQLMVKPGQAIITCGQVNNFMAPCVTYLTARGEPSDSCCQGVVSLVGMTTNNTADKRAACVCIKNAAKFLPDIKDDAAQALPGKCGVKLDVDLSKEVNCDTLS